MDKHGLQSSKSLFLVKIMLLPNLTNESIGKRKAVVEIEQRAGPSQSTNPHLQCQGNPFSSSSGLGPAAIPSNAQPQGPQHGRPALGWVTVPTCTQAACLPWWVNLSWLPYAHQAALALLPSNSSTSSPLSRAAMMGNGGCHITPLHLSQSVRWYVPSSQPTQCLPPSRHGAFGCSAFNSSLFTSPGTS